MNHELHKAPDTGDGITVLVCHDCGRSVALKPDGIEVINQGDFWIAHSWGDGLEVGIDTTAK